VYELGAAHARERGIILADTKFEFGRRADGTIVLGDEVLTPDSSRFWPAEGYEPGHGQPSFDKQYVRDWASGSGWDKTPPAPALPDDVIARTRELYVDAYERITGEPFEAWLERSA
jgi:phosphoribosylaminoimidazole-succinocarboxamide synthase